MDNEKTKIPPKPESVSDVWDWQVMKAEAAERREESVKLLEEFRPKYNSHLADKGKDEALDDSLARFKVSLDRLETSVQRWDDTLAMLENLIESSGDYDDSMMYLRRLVDDGKLKILTTNRIVIKIEGRFDEELAKKAIRSTSYRPQFYRLVSPTDSRTRYELRSAFGELYDDDMLMEVGVDIHLGNWLISCRPKLKVPTEYED